MQSNQVIGGEDELMEAQLPDEEQQQPPTQEIDMTEAGPSDMPEEGAAEEAGYEICIKVKGKKSFSVYLERGEEENALGDEGNEVSTFADALRECMRIYKENPPSDAGAVEQMQAGFGSPEQKY